MRPAQVIAITGVERSLADQHFSTRRLRPFETSSEGTSRKSVHPPEQIHVRPLADGGSGRAQWR
ncbi:MAG TPA: hypothetical protein PLQ14_14020, partial [Actinomycetota bacterium]|nr:hypothetical protein [Actinomycetota bacterium]